MQKIIAIIIVLVSFVSCNLDKLEPAQTKSFMKIYGDTGNTEGIDLLKLDDGYLLLGINIFQGISRTVLVKTDLNGNQIWSSNFENIEGSAIAKSDNSYFIVGDRINPSDQLITSMSLIKTDLDGVQLQDVTISELNSPYHGTGVTFSALGEVVVCGYINGLASGTDTTFIVGYDESSLVRSWLSVKKWVTDGDKRISSKTLLEDAQGDFVWTSLYNDGSSGATNFIQSIEVPRDAPDIIGGLELFDGELLLDDNLGDFGVHSDGGVIVQSVNNAKSGILVATYSSLIEGNKFTIESADNNFYAGTVMQASDGDIVILGSTDQHADGSVRADLDFYLTKVGFDGSVSVSTGFTSIIGGTGNETAAAIVQAEDRGFVFLGTMKNTNDVNVMVLVKVNNKGEMIN